MKTALPWLLVTLLAGGLFFVFQQGQRKDSELVELKKQVSELNTVQSEVQELRQAEVSQEEVARLRKDNAEIYQLRNKASQLQKELAKGAAQTRQSQPSSAEAIYEKTGRLTPEQIQQVIRENQQLRSEAQEIELLRHRDAEEKSASLQPINVCINNLRQLDGAMDQWAIENKKKEGDLVTANDVTPYLKKFPQCPSGGTYTLGTIGTAPTCNVAGHVLPR